MAFFNTWFFKQFPPRYQSLDSYKDVDNRGLLERYLGDVIGVELDVSIKNELDTFLNIWNLNKTPTNLLPFMGGNLGYVPNLQTTSRQYRKLLSYIIPIYQTKGTELSFQLVYKILGYECKIIEEVPKKSTKYDSLYLYDAEPDLEIYDQDCDVCSNFWIALKPLNSNPLFLPSFTFSPLEIQQGLEIAEWLRPLNAIYKGLVRLGITTDTITSNTTDQLTYTIIN